MYIPESKSIRNVGWGPYRKAAKHWMKTWWHWLAYKLNELKARMPFFDKELCCVKGFGELVLAAGHMYAISVLICDYDTVVEMRDVYNETVSMWTEICSG